ncbi:MAG TPA: MFS transporter [Dehalococcoidia bacterium]|nr:MFS transporter [Dehalococcoidia bacterium]
MTVTTDRPALWTRDYTLTLAAMHLYFLSFYGLFAALPLYLEDWSDAAIGLNVGAMSFAAVVARPFAGVVIDQTGRRRSMLWGAAITAVGVLALAATDNPYALLPARLLHGAAIAFFTTATLALVTDVVPPDRRGQGVAYFGVLNNSVAAYAPFLGLAVAEGAGFGVLVAGLAATTLVSFVLTLPIHEPQAGEGHPDDEPTRLVSRRALPSAAAFLGVTVAFGATQAFGALFAEDRDLGNAGAFFALNGIMQTLGRFPAGPLVDRFGRGAVAVPGLLLAGAAMFALASGASVTFFLGGAMLGLAVALTHTALLAQTMDRAGPRERGAAIATFTNSWDAGAVVGATMLGPVAAAFGYPTVFVITGAVGFASAAGYPFLHRRPKSAALAGR